MTEQNELYVKSQERWIKEQELIIETLEENLRNSKTMVILHSKMAKIASESIEHEQHNLKRNVELFNEWKNQNL